MKKLVSKVLYLQKSLVLKLQKLFFKLAQTCICRRISSRTLRLFKRRTKVLFSKALGDFASSFCHFQVSLGRINLFRKCALIKTHQKCS